MGMSNNSEKFYTVGKFAERVGVTIRTLRYYDKKGLLEPSDYSKSGYRLYSESDFAKFQKILTLKYLGFSLKEIGEAIKGDIEKNNLKISLKSQKEILKDKLLHMSLIIKSIEETEEMIENNDELQWESFIEIIKAINAETIILNQYKNSSNLKSRINIHDMYSTNKYGWHKWIFDNVEITPKIKILELGCGNGILWCKNKDRIPNDCEIYITDISKGMLEDAKRNLESIKGNFIFEIVDAKDIPFDNSTFDIVIANHMLFYIKDKNRVFSEINRVLKQDGNFYTSTIGHKHMIELKDLALEFDRRIVLEQTDSDYEFSLENGQKHLEQYFNKVELQNYEDSLVVDKVEPLLDYIYSTPGNIKDILKGREEDFKVFLTTKVRSYGNIFIRKHSGLFICKKY